MRKYFFVICLIACSSWLAAQPFSDVKTIAATAVKNQAMTGTCWCFSTTSLVESQCIKDTKENIDLSEMYTVRNIYVEKARNYLLRQGKAQFGEGGLGHDVIRSIGAYGAEPLSVYTGLPEGKKMLNHAKLIAQLQTYLDSLLKLRPLPADWLTGYNKILDDNMGGAAPAEFAYNGKNYNPISFAKDVLKFDPADYVSITSFTHHPFYQPFILEAPDNFANGSFNNLPLDEMIKLVQTALDNGYSVMWDADVSNNGFRQDKGLALNLDPTKKYSAVDADMQEEPWTAAKRQALYENLTTEDDHLMHIVGIEKSKGGKTFFVVKNSWGKVGPFDGYINVSESYFAINTVSLVVPKAAISKEEKAKMGIK